METMSRMDTTIIPVYADPDCDPAPQAAPNSPVALSPPKPPAMTGLPIPDSSPKTAEPPKPARDPDVTKANKKSLSNSNQRTKNQFRPRLGKGGSTSYQLRQYAEVTLGGGSLRKVVKLPEGEDENEWLAVNSESRDSPYLRKRTQS